MSTVKPLRAGGASLTVMERLSSSSDGRGVAMTTRIGEWAAGHPKISRVWMCGDDAGDDTHEETTVELALEIEPVGDSEETATLWIAQGDRWRRELQRRLGCRVELLWLDPDRGRSEPGATAADARALVYDRYG